MPVHKNRIEGLRSIFTHPSKFIERINTQMLAKQAVEEGKQLRQLIAGKRILEDLRDLKNAFRL
jgi:hypothetical protein